MRRFTGGMRFLVLAVVVDVTDQGLPSGADAMVAPETTHPAGIATRNEPSGCCASRFVTV